ncbi:hypothetical protein Gpo141_00001583 [Globisporangium polare]
MSCAVRVSLAVLHGACAGYLVACARLYWYMEHPYLTYFVDLLAPSQHRHFRLIGTALSCIGALHALRFFELVTPWALRKRYFEPAFASKILTAKTLASIPCTTQARHRITTAWWQLFGKQGVLDENSRCFHWITVTIELIQIATQVYQAHRSSHLISRVWINRCYVAIVVLYCWTTPLLHQFLQSNTSVKRMACLAVDALLNISYSIILPLVIFVPYILEYDVAAYSFDLSILYGDESFGNLVLENQSIFAVSLLDCGSKLVPHLSTYWSLRSISLLVNNQSTTAPTNVMRVTPSQVAATLGPNEQEFKGATASKAPLWKRKIFTAVRFVYSCLGVAILSIHVIAVHRFNGATVLGCKQTMHPWFANKFSCSVLEFNCYRHGVASPGPDAFDFLDEQTLISLVISHCPALVVPQSIQSFPNLLGIEIFNSTIAEWSADAAISASIHTKLVFAELILVNMTKLPDGILGPLPDMLQDIELSVTNLTALPDDLHERWHSLSVLYLEYSEIEVFPETLLKLEVYDLSLIGNRIQAVHEFSTAQSNYYVLALSHNPLEALPDTVPSGFSIDFLALESTNMESLPAWTKARVNELVYLSSSPICTSSHDQSAPISTGGTFVCDEKDPRGDGRYPLNLTLPDRVP